MADSKFVTDSLGRSIEIREVGIEDQFDLLEAAGANADNRQWFGLAVLIFSALSIDGTPLPRPTAKLGFKKNAATLKKEGVDAIASFFKQKHESEGEDVVDEARDAAKN